MQEGDQVRIGTEGVSVFTIVSIDEEARTAIVESTSDAPGKCPFPTRPANLTPAL
ncbi:hypothetical protein ACFVWF_33090 [Rhodococcus qingshengii]|uniref:hypothetical protein n=1 Tax=Rhodococcus qingshengii TaxID=334542 RepID=UPI0036DD7890